MSSELDVDKGAGGELEVEGGEGGGLVDTYEQEEGEDEEDERPRVSLRGDGLDLRDLLDGSKESTFEVKDDPSFTEDESFRQYGPGDVYKYFKEDILDGDDDPENEALSTFDKLSLRMTDVTTDGGVRKEVLRPGTGDIVYPGAHVTIHYNAYLELSDEPFDSTRLRGEPISFNLVRGDEDSAVLTGINCGVGSMRKGELARFLLQPEYFYGRHGCPPRIPGNIPSVYVIELVRFSEGVAGEYYALSAAERKDAPFDVMMAAVNKIRDDGRAYFKKNNYPQANRAYRRGVRILEEYHLKNDVEEVEQSKMILSFYKNLCIVSLKLPQGCDSVLHFANLALRIDPANHAFFYYKAEALLSKGQLDQATKQALSARALAPSNSKIRELVARIEAKKKFTSQSERVMYEKMFARPTPPTQSAQPTAPTRALPAAASAVQSTSSTRAAQSSATARPGAVHQSHPQGEAGGAVKGLGGVEAAGGAVRARDSVSAASRQMFMDRLRGFQEDGECAELALSSASLSASELDLLQELARSLGLLVTRTLQDNQVLMRVYKKSPQ